MREIEYPCDTCMHNADVTELYKSPICNECGFQFFTTANLPYEKDQEAKADAGKTPLTMVPRRIIWDIGKVREYGNKKYGDPENWRTVEKERYRDAAFRHFLQYLDNPEGIDQESGLPHLWHLACNIAFLCEMEGEEVGKN